MTASDIQRHPMTANDSQLPVSSPAYRATVHRLAAESLGLANLQLHLEAVVEILVSPLDLRGGEGEGELPLGDR